MSRGSRSPSVATRCRAWQPSALLPACTRLSPAQPEPGGEAKGSRRWKQEMEAPSPEA